MTNRTPLYDDLLEERVLKRCQEKFGQSMSLNYCASILLTLKQYEKRGFESCPQNLSLPATAHTPYFNSDCGVFERAIHQYAIPLLQLLCLAGNFLNLLIYRLPYFDGSASVHFLRAKAIANIIFVQSRIFEVIHAWTLQPNEFFELFYWKTKPYAMTIANISGTISNWMTLLVTIETVLCVLLPFAFRHYCTKKLSVVLLSSSIIISICIHLTFIFTHVIETSITFLEFNLDIGPCYWPVKTYSMQLINDKGYKLYEKLYYWTQMTLSIVLPTMAMLICSILVITRFTFKELGKAFSQRRRCVIMMTVSTTMSHLLLEGPATLTFGIAAIKGTGDMKINSTMCMINHSSNLLSIINATIPFFVYLICNKQFRRMASVFISATCSTSPTHKRILLDEACARTRSLTVRHAQRKNSLTQLTYNC